LMYFKAWGSSLAMSSEAVKLSVDVSKLPAWIRRVVWRARPIASCQVDSERASVAGVQVDWLGAIGKSRYAQTAGVSAG
jgi:hypothetical protein